MYIPYDEKQIYLFSSADWKCELKSLNTSNHPKSMKDTQSFWANVDIKLWVPVFIWWTLEGSMHLETYSAPYNCDENIHSAERQPTLWLHDLCILTVLSVYGKELRLFMGQGIHTTRSINVTRQTKQQ